MSRYLFLEWKSEDKQTRLAVISLLILYISVAIPVFFFSEYFPKFLGILLVIRPQKVRISLNVEHFRQICWKFIRSPYVYASFLLFVYLLFILYVLFIYLLFIVVWFPHAIVRLFQYCRILPAIGFFAFLPDSMDFSHNNRYVNIMILEVEQIS